MPNVPARSNQRYIVLLFIIAIIGVLIDYLTKQWAQNSLVLSSGESIEVIPSFLKWTLAFNYGAAFSFLANHAGWQRWFLIGVSTVASIVLTIWIIKGRAHERFLSLGLALILAGAVGNWIDRVFRYKGGVVDFIHVYYGAYNFPIFNVADICVSVGAGIVILVAIIHKPPEKIK